jgi:hypothetical protein
MTPTLAMCVLGEDVDVEREHSTRRIAEQLVGKQRHGVPFDGRPATELDGQLSAVLQPAL